MDITSAQVQKILTGDYRFKQLAFSMMVTRLRLLYRQDQSPIVLQVCEKEIMSFLRQYAPIMPADVAIISKI